MPISIAISAFFFNCINGLLNGIYVGYFLEADLVVNSTFILGMLLFFSGMYINISSDNKLISLRKKSEGYKIPDGELFKFISCPNHFGEIIEWFGEKKLDNCGLITGEKGNLSVIEFDNQEIFSNLYKKIKEDLVRIC